MSKIQVNRQYKDRLFKLVFSNKEDLLDLYNAINDTNYSNLYEHQSTFSLNLPLRGLIYFARLYQKMIENEKRLYSGKLIKLPYLQFIVFYNGTMEEPERQVLELSNAFPNWSNKENAALNCKAIVLNINLGYNKKVMEKCKKLKEYAQYIARVREYLDANCDIETAIDKATDECIAESILEQILRNNRGEVRSMLLTQYDEQAHIEYEKELSFEEGFEKGIIATIKSCKSLSANKTDVQSQLITNFSLEENEANEYIEKYW